jgi:hypothetical protein
MSNQVTDVNLFTGEMLKQLEDLLHVDNQPHANNRKHFKDQSDRIRAIADLWLGLPPEQK